MQDAREEDDSRAYEAQRAREVAFFSDVHFWSVEWRLSSLASKVPLGNLNVLLRRRAEFPPVEKEVSISELLRLKPDYFICGGDLTSVASEKEFRLALQFLERFRQNGISGKVILGNHDVYTHAAYRKRRGRALLGEWVAQEDKPVVTDQAGIRFVLVSTACPRVLSSRGRFRLSDESLIEEAINSAPGGPVVIVSHYPLLSSTNQYRLTWGRRMVNAERLRLLLGSMGRDIFFLAGHVHRFSSVQDPIYPNLWHMTAPPFAGHHPSSDARGGFLMLRSDHGRLQVRYHRRVGDRWDLEDLALRRTISVSD